MIYYKYIINNLIIKILNNFNLYLKIWKKKLTDFSECLIRTVSKVNSGTLIPKNEIFSDLYYQTTVNGQIQWTI